MDKTKIRKYLALGLAGAVITTAGEMLQGIAPTADITGSLFASETLELLAEMLETHASLPSWRIGLGSTIGAVGILLQFFGVYAIYLSFTDKNDRASALYKAGAYNYAFVGAIVHVLMSMMIYVHKLDMTWVADFTLWFAAPIVALFLVGYVWFSVIMFNKLRKRQTIFPAWCCVLNPIVGKMVFNAVAELLPPSALSNGIGYSNMGLTAALMFAVLLCCTHGEE